MVVVNMFLTTVNISGSKMLHPKIQELENWAKKGSIVEIVHMVKLLSKLSKSSALSGYLLV